MTTIVAEPSLERRVKVIKKMVKVASECTRRRVGARRGGGD